MNEEIKEILDYIDDRIIPNEKFKQIRNYITNLQQEKDKYKKRCYKSLKLIRDNYGVLDKYGIDMLDDILNGGNE